MWKRKDSCWKCFVNKLWTNERLFGSFETFAVCGARYKTRPGLTYHYSHSHRDGASDDSRDSVSASNGPLMGGIMGGAIGTSTTSSGLMGGGLMSGGGVTVAGAGGVAGPPISGTAAGLMGGVLPQQAGVVGGPAPDLAAQGPGHVYQDSYVTFLSHPAGTALFFFTFFSVFVLCACMWMSFDLFLFIIFYNI